MVASSLDYRACSVCHFGHVGLGLVAEQSKQPRALTYCDRCKTDTLVACEAPEDVKADLRARGFLPALDGMPEWFQKHVKPTEDGLNVHQFAWILSRPESVQKLLLKFPPGCVVRVKETQRIGVMFGIVAGDSNFPTIKVAWKPGAKDDTPEFTPDELDVVGYWNGVTPDVVMGILEAGRPMTIVNKGPKVGRNDPCPCSSGKKHKHCCGKLGLDASDQRHGLQ